MNIKTANDRIKAGLLLPDIFSLLGDLWQAGELAILFGGTGSGKSILGVQIGDGLSNGENVWYELKNENPPLIVLYMDFELSDKQFQVRYTSDDKKSTYQFSDNFKMVNIPFGEIYEPGKNITAKIFELIEKCLEETEAKVLIIDNLTALSTEDNKDGNVAMEIMSYLDKLKRKNGYSILVIGHTPKKFEFTPLTNGDLAGSSKITQFADAVFALGKSVIDNDFRYLKPTKNSRSKKETYHSNNVITIKKIKETNFLKFEYEGTTTEDEHLSKNGDDKKLQAIAMRNQGLPIRTIAEKLGLSVGTISNYTKNEKNLKPFERNEQNEHSEQIEQSEQNEHGEQLERNEQKTPF